MDSGKPDSGKKYSDRCAEPGTIPFRGQRGRGDDAWGGPEQKCGNAELYELARGLPGDSGNPSGGAGLAAVEGGQGYSPFGIC